MPTPHEKYFISQHYKLNSAYENLNSVEAVYDYLFFTSILMTWAHYVRRTLETLSILAHYYIHLIQFIRQQSTYHES